MNDKQANANDTGGVDLLPSQKQGRFSTVIRSHLRQDFFALPNKGEVVNDLLEIYFEKVTATNKVARK